MTKSHRVFSVSTCSHVCVDIHNIMTTIAPMKRTNLYLPTSQLDALRALSEETGAPVSELVRRAIQAYVEDKKNDNSNQDPDPPV